jgi:hypothetical protein
LAPSMLFLSNQAAASRILDTGPVPSEPSILSDTIGTPAEQQHAAISQNMDDMSMTPCLEHCYGPSTAAHMPAGDLQPFRTLGTVEATHADSHARQQHVGVGPTQVQSIRAQCSHSLCDCIAEYSVCVAMIVPTAALGLCSSC